MVKVTIDPSIPRLTEEEKEEIQERATPVDLETDEAAREQMRGVQEVILSPQVVEQLKAEGVDVDEFVAMLLKAAGATQ